MWAVDNIAPAYMPMPFLFLLGLLCDIISLTSPKITKAIHLLLAFCKNGIIIFKSWDFDILNFYLFTNQFLIEYKLVYSF